MMLQLTTGGFVAIPEVTSPGPGAGIGTYELGYGAEPGDVRWHIITEIQQRFGMCRCFPGNHYSCIDCSAALCQCVGNEAFGTEAPEQAIQFSGLFPVAGIQLQR